MAKKIPGLHKKSAAPAGTLTIGDKTIKLSLGTLASIIAQRGKIKGNVEEFGLALWYAQNAKDDQKRIDKNDDSGHYRFPPDKREEWVRKYREARRAGKVSRKDAWVEINIGIDVRTFQNWEDMYPEE